MNKEEGYIIIIKDRYFYGLGKKKRVCTAWSIPGAKIVSRDELHKVVKILQEKKLKYEIKIVLLRG